MAEYILREAALACFHDWVDSHGHVHEADEDAAYQRIEGIPAADVVARDCYDRLLAENDRLRKERPVVRCADCKWFQINMRGDGYLPKGVPECECRHWCGACDPTDFCSYGERKDGDGE